MTHARTALLVMDVQAIALDRLPDKQAFLSRVEQAVTAARGRGVPVVFVVVGFRQGLPEVSERNQTFRMLKQMDASVLVDSRPALALAEGDVVVVKRRVSAFTGSDLEVVLRAKQIEHLVLAGIATSGVVLSTLREAADKDYRLTVLSDLCADADPEVHALLLGRVFPRQAEVKTVAEWLGPDP